MRFFRSLLVSALIGGILAGVAFAAGTTANLSWTAPTAYVDSTPLPSSDIDHYTITWAPATGQVGPSGSETVPGSAVTSTAPVPCGSTSFSITVTTTATAHYPNATSAPAGPVPYASKVTCSPNPPGGLAAS